MASEITIVRKLAPQIAILSCGHTVRVNSGSAVGDSGACPKCPSPRFDFVAHLHRQRQFSERTFGPGTRTKGVLDHILRELAEIEAAPTDISEWIDVVILALDGAWRAGFTPDQIVDALVAKQTKNESRQWPDWRTVPTDAAIQHVRSEDPS